MQAASSCMVHHVDPTHQSIMVHPLASHTSMTVTEAADGVPLERDHPYIVSSGTYLSVAEGAMRVAMPLALDGARLPFDFVLHSLAIDCEANAVCVILSGPGVGGSLGRQTMKGKGRFIIVQDGDMPWNAIFTGLVDIVLPVADMPTALVNHHAGSVCNDASRLLPAQDGAHTGYLSLSTCFVPTPGMFSRCISQGHRSAGPSGVWR